MLICGCGGVSGRPGVVLLDGLRGPESLLDVGPGGDRLDVLLVGDPCDWDEQLWSNLRKATVAEIWWVVVPFHTLRVARCGTTL